MAVRRTTVISAAGSPLLVMLTIVKEELGISSGDATHDTQLNRYIAAASAVAAQYCNRAFQQQTVIDTFDIGIARFQAQGEQSLQFSAWPTISVASLTENAIALVKDTDYRIDADTGIAYRLSTTSGHDTSWRTTPVVATYDGNYAAIPLDVQDAITRLVRGRWYAKGRDPLARSESIPGVRDVAFWVPTGSDAGNLPPDVVDLLDNYRVPVTA